MGLDKVERGPNDLKGKSSTAGNLVFAGVLREFLETGMLLMSLRNMLP
jgi:hypothetical protein